MGSTRLFVLGVLAKGEPMHGHQIRLGVQPTLLESVKTACPLGRLGTPEEAAGAVLFFCSPLWDTWACALPANAIAAIATAESAALKVLLDRVMSSPRFERSGRVEPCRARSGTRRTTLFGTFVCSP